MSDIEAKAEKLCDVIMKKDEFWETKNKAILLLIDLVLPYENQSDDILDEVFSAGFFRLLKEPVKAMICDLRSQQVRDITNLLSVISQISGDRMKGFLRDSFNSILDGVKVPNKVMSGYVDESILLLIRNVTFKNGIVLIVNEVKENKAKYVRERCLDYLNEILINWEVADREADILCDAIRVGLEDASVKSREIARSAYMNMFQRFPKKTEKIKSSLSATSLKVKLQSAEAELTMNTSSSTIESGVTSAGTITISEKKPPSTSTKAPVPPPTTSTKAPAPPPTPHEKRVSSDHHHPHTSSKASASVSAGHHTSSESLASSGSSGGSGGGGGGHTNTRASSSHGHASHHHASIPSHVVSTPAHKDRSSSSAAATAAAATSSSQSVADLGASSRSTIAAFRQTARRRSMVANPFESITSSIHTSLEADEDDEAASAASSGGRPSPTKSNPSPIGGGSPTKHSTSKSSPEKKKSSVEGSPSKRPPTATDATANNGPANVFSFPTNKSVDSMASENPLRTHSSMSNSSVNISKNIQVDATVQVSRGKDTLTTGVVRFIGKTQFAAGVWIGVELFTEQGKNDGSVQGVSYFECPPNRGLFVKEENVEVLSVPGAAEDPADSTASNGIGYISDGDYSPPNKSSGKRASGDIGDEIRDALNASSSFVKTGSQPRLPSISPMVHGHLSNVNESNGKEKRTQLKGVLKLKVAQLLETLNGQMDLVKQLEDQEKTDAPFSADAYRNAIDEIVDFTTQELELIHSFKSSLVSQQLY